MLKLESIYNYEKINSLFKNFDTMSLLDLVIIKTIKIMVIIKAF